jgi:hypothetical protein
MAMPGPEKWTLDNPLDVFVERGGTTYLEMFIVNGNMTIRSKSCG